MRFLSLLISLAIIGYTASIYLNSGDLQSSVPDKTITKPKQYIDHARQATDQINETMKKQKKAIDDQIN